MAALATGLGVAQLVLWVGKIILKITQEADKVRRKKQDCAYLVRYLSVIHKMLPTLPEDPEGGASADPPLLHATGGG
jgi:hypothetical protein